MELDRTENSPTFSSGEKYLWIALAPILLVVATAYWPMLDNYFASDDFVHINFSLNSGLDLASFFRPINEHLQPFHRLIFAIEGKLFGVDPGGYYGVNLALHLLNTLLVFALASRIGASRLVGLIASFFFGITAAHYRTTMWLATQGQLWAAFWLLISMTMLLFHIDKGKMTFLIASYLSYLLMVSAFTSGPEVFLIAFGLLMLGDRSERTAIEKAKRHAIFSVPYLVIFLFFLLLRKIIMSTGAGFLASSGGIGGIIFGLPKVVFFAAAGIKNGLVKSVVGGYNLGSAMEWAMIIIIVAAAFSALDYRKASSRRFQLLIGLLAFWMLASYCLPILPRLKWGVGWFASRSRYWYLPAIPASIIIGMVVANLKTFTRGGWWQYTAAALVFLLMFVGSSNFVRIRTEEKQISDSTHAFDKSVGVYLGDLGSVIGRGRDFRIINKSFNSDAAKYAGWNVPPVILAKMYFGEAQINRGWFIPEKSAAEIPPQIPVYQVLPTGKLSQVN